MSRPSSLTRRLQKMLRSHLRQGEHKGPEGEFALHEHGDPPVVVRKPDEDLPLVHECPPVFWVGFDLDRRELTHGRLQPLSAQGMDLDGPVFAAVVDFDGNDLAHDEVFPRPEIVQHRQAILYMLRDGQGLRRVVVQPADHDVSCVVKCQLAASLFPP